MSNAPIQCCVAFSRARPDHGTGLRPGRICPREQRRRCRERGPGFTGPLTGQRPATCLGFRWRSWRQQNVTGTTLASNVVTAQPGRGWHYRRGVAGHGHTRHLATISLAGGWRDAALHGRRRQPLPSAIVAWDGPERLHGPAPSRRRWPATPAPLPRWPGTESSAAWASTAAPRSCTMPQPLAR